MVIEFLNRSVKSLKSIGEIRATTQQEHISTREVVQLELTVRKGYMS